MTKLTDEHKFEILRHNNLGLSTKQIQDISGIPKSTISDFLSRRTHKKWWENNSDVASGTLSDHRDNIEKLTGTAFILTSAQNNTYVNDKFLKTLENIAEHKSARILCSTFTYNLNGFQVYDHDGDWYDPKIKEYIHNEPAYIANDLLWCGELNIIPTAANPLSGLQSYTMHMSGVVPHAKVQLESLPRHKALEPRFLYTTGTVTLRNYIQQKAGQKASFHHIFGALLVEIDKDGTWFARQLVADEKGEVHDLDKHYYPDGRIKETNAEAINYGDIHIEKINTDITACVFDSETSILNVLKPKYQFIHDVLDFEARNHHTIDDSYIRFKKHGTPKDNVENNIKDVSKFLSWIHRDFSNTVVVESNHDLAFSKWLKEADYRYDPENALYFLKNQYRQYIAMNNNEKRFSIFEHAVTAITQASADALNKVTFLREDDSFKICNESSENLNGIECGIHGHNGINGARGGITSFTKLGSRYNTGHSHSAAIKDGVYVAGVTGKLDMGYNKGATTWSHSHIVTYQNGKRAIITIKNNKWRIE